MKTDFPILFVDDNKEFVDSLTPPASAWLERHGFDLDVHHLKSAKGVPAELKKKDFELVVVDYRLGGEKMGDEVIRDIREREYFQDIIFYSQGGLPEDVIKGHLNGVFYANKGDAKTFLKALIELKLRRATDLATFRGWVIADSIELEASLGRVLARFFGKHEALFIQRVLDEEVFDLGKKQAILNGIVKDHLKDKTGEEADSIRECKKILTDFVEEIIHVRNALAHQLHEIGESGFKVVKTRIKNPRPIVFTAEECAKIRKNIKKHRENLARLGKLVKA